MASPEINKIEHLNADKLRAAERRENLTIFALSLPALIAVLVVIVILRLVVVRRYGMEVLGQQPMDY